MKKKDKLIIGIIISSVILLIIGITFSFIPLENIGIEVTNDGYVGAIFSLTSVILFFGALVYQIREYKNQLLELQNSVEAQKKSGNELEAQRKILIQQNYQKLIFELLKELDLFKSQNEVNKGVGLLVKPSEREKMNEIPINQKEYFKKVEYFKNLNELAFKTIFENYHSYLKAQEFVNEGNFVITTFLSLMDCINLTLSKIDDPVLKNTLSAGIKCHLSLEEWSFYMVKVSAENNVNCFAWDLFTTKHLVNLAKDVGILACNNFEENDYINFCNYLNNL